MKKVLFICHGNICRSVMAEYIFKAKTDANKYYCESRAVSYEEIGNDIYPPVKRVLDRHHVAYTRHYASIVTEKDYEEYDEIFVMDDSNLFNFNRLIKDKDNKVKKLLDIDIEDPWYSGNYEKVYEEITMGIDRYLNKDKENA